MTFSAIVIAALLVSSPDLQVQRLVEAQQSTVGLIQQLDMELSLEELSLNGERHSPPLTRSRYRWSKSGALERQRFQEFQGKTVYTEGRTIGFGDMLEDGTRMHVLLDYNPIDPPKLHPRMQKGVTAWERAQGPLTTGWFTNPSCDFAMFQIQVRLNDDRRSLADFVAGSPSVEYGGRVDVEGRILETVTASHPDSVRGGANAGMSVELYFDPAVGYLIRRMVMHFPESVDLKKTDVVKNIEEFRSFDNGVFVPVKETFTMYAPGLLKGPELECVQTASKMTVNQPLPSDALDFKYPENCVVVDDEIVGGRHLAHLYGPDKVVRDIHELADLGPLPGQKYLPTSRQGTVLTIFGVLVVLAAFGYFIRRRE